MISFAGKTAIVTGAGGGLGRCYALELARRGARVVVNDLGGAADGRGAGTAADAVVAEIAAMGGEAIANRASVTDREGVAAMVEQAMKAFGRIDILVNNAGILRDKSFMKLELDDAQAVLDVHLMGAFNCSKAVWPVMMEQEYGRIVMTTSPSGLYGNFGQANYGAAKMGLVGLMNTLKIEGAKRHIHVNAISPVAATRMTAGLMPQEQLDRLGPEHIVPGVVYLCSEGAPSGAILQAAGGSFSLAAIMESPWVELGPQASADDVAAQWERIADLSVARTRG
ncbi:SDR family NAD(P)-dependent oxidoreductase [Telluria sp. B2]